MIAALHLPDGLVDKQEWTVDDLASLPKDLRYELIDGRLILPSPTDIHNQIGLEVILALRVNCPRTLSATYEMSLKVNPRNEPRPDVVVFERKYGAVSPVPVSAALLAVEIISPDSNVRDLHTKPKVYAKAGLPSYWVIDPFHDAGIVLAEFRLGDAGQYELLTETAKVFTTDVPFPVTVDLPALTAMRQETLDLANEGE
jgi:Uma2 family endonuclease